MRLPSAFRLESNPGLASVVQRLARPFWQGLAICLLFIADVTLSFFANSWLSSSDMSNYASTSSITSTVYSVWTIISFTTAALIALYVLFVLPLVWGRRYGWKRVIQIIGSALLYLLVALVISTFILHLTDTNQTNPPCGSCNCCSGGLCTGANFNVDSAPVICQ